MNRCDNRSRHKIDQSNKKRKTGNTSPESSEGEDVAHAIFANQKDKHHQSELKILGLQKDLEHKNTQIESLKELHQKDLKIMELEHEIALQKQKDFYEQQLQNQQK